jgi:hypothetical protein
VQYLALLAALPEELRVPLVIGYHTGARKSEVLSIRLDQVDLKDQKIRLYDTKKHAEGRWLPIYGERKMFWKSKSRIPDGCIQLALGFLIVMGSAWLSFAPHGQMLASLSV